VRDKISLTIHCEFEKSFRGMIESIDRHCNRSFLKIGGLMTNVSPVDKFVRKAEKKFHTFKTFNPVLDFASWYERVGFKMRVRLHGK
jgi:hypothetical protein